MQTESPAVKTLSLGRLVAAEMLITGLCVWLAMVMQAGNHSALLYDSTARFSFAFCLLATLPLLRRRCFSRSWLRSLLREIIIALVLSACVLGVMMLLIPFTAPKMLFPAAVLAALAGVVAAGYYRSISRVRK